MKPSGLNEQDSRKRMLIRPPGFQERRCAGLQFLEELAGICPDTDIKEAQQLEVVEKKPADKPPEPETAASIPEPPVKEGRSRPKIDFEGINREIEESLNELEQLKAKVIPITERRDPRPDSTESTPAKATVNVPAAALAPPVKTEPAKLPEVVDAGIRSGKHWSCFAAGLPHTDPTLG